MHTETEADDYRRRFREMELGGLVEAWEEPMPDAVRALLQSGLEARRYRIQSLPEPPSQPTADDIRPPTVTPLTWREHAQGQIGAALKILAIMAFVAGLRSATKLERLAPEQGCRAGFPRRRARAAGA